MTTCCSYWLRKRRILNPWIPGSNWSSQVSCCWVLRNSWIAMHIGKRGSKEQTKKGGREGVSERGRSSNNFTLLNWTLPSAYQIKQEISKVLMKNRTCRQSEEKIKTVWICWLPTREVGDQSASEELHILWDWRRGKAERVASLSLSLLSLLLCLGLFLSGPRERWPFAVKNLQGHDPDSSTRKTPRENRDTFIQTPSDRFARWASPGTGGRGRVFFLIVSYQGFYLSNFTLYPTLRAASPYCSRTGDH